MSITITREEINEWKCQRYSYMSPSSSCKSLENVGQSFEWLKRKRWSVNCWPTAFMQSSRVGTIRQNKLSTNVLRCVYALRSVRIKGKHIWLEDSVCFWLFNWCVVIAWIGSDHSDAQSGREVSRAPGVFALRWHYSCHGDVGATFQLPSRYPRILLLLILLLL